MIKKNKKRIIVFSAVLGLLVFLSSSNALKPIESLALKALNPMMDFFYSASHSIKIKYGPNNDEEDIRKKHEELSREYNKILNENVQLKLLEEENRILREYLGFFEKNGHNYVLSKVIAMGGEAGSVYESEAIIINKGRRDGLSAGLAAISSQGVIIGKVSEVKENISKVSLINGNQSKISAAVLGQPGTNGIAEGELGLTVRMNYIPQNIEIAKDDTIITSGLEENIPRGLPVGQVVQVNKENNELWQNAVIEPFYSPSDLIIISVLIPEI